MHNSARSRDNLRSPLNTKCNTGLFVASAHILNNPPRKQYFAWQEVKKTLSPKKSFMFPIENGQQQNYLFLFEYSRRPSWFLFPHPHRWSKSQAPPLPTHLNINWRLTYQCQYVFLSRADIRMQSSLLWAADKRQKGEGGQPTWYDTTCFSLCRIFNSPQSLLLSGPFDNIYTDQSFLSM